MPKLLRALLFFLFLFAVLTAPAAAELEWSVVSQQKLDRAPLDMVVSPVDQRLFVLLEEGAIQVFAPEGQLLQQLDIGGTAQNLAISGDGQRLFLSDPAGKQLQVIEVADVHSLPVGDSPIKGNPAAPVTITVFDDFQCPYCARLAPFLEQLLAAYSDQLRIVFKHFPLPTHTFARPAAIASMAAHDQGKFWELHDRLFANYNKLNDSLIRSLAASIGLDMARFDQAVTNPAYVQQLEADLRLGRQVGVRGTPTVFINGKLLRQRSANRFRLAIDQELAKLKRD